MQRQTKQKKLHFSGRRCLFRDFTLSPALFLPVPQHSLVESFARVCLFKEIASLSRTHKDTRIERSRVHRGCWMHSKKSRCLGLPHLGAHLYIPVSVATCKKRQPETNKQMKMSYLCLCEVSCERRMGKGSFFCFQLFPFLFRTHSMCWQAGRMCLSSAMVGKPLKPAPGTSCRSLETMPSMPHTLALNAN